MSSKIRVGVIGTSAFAETTHIAPLAGHPGAELAAICGRGRARAEALAQTYHIPQVFTGYQDLIDHAGIDAVVVVAPDDCHYPMSMAALRANKHIFCEKPLALTLEQAREMVETAERLGRVNMTMFTWRWIPAIAHMGDLVRQGYLGQLRQGQFSYLLSLGRGPAATWRSDRARANGMISDLGAHLIDLARVLGGDIRRVAARLAVYNNRLGSDGQPLDQTHDSAVLLLEFAGGAQATLQVSSVAYLGDEIQTITIDLYGAAGTLALDFPQAEGARLRGGREGRPIQEIAAPAGLWYGTDPTLSPPERFNRLLLTAPVGERLFIDAILTGQPAQPSFYDAWKVQQVIAAALQSGQTGQWVNIDPD